MSTLIPIAATLIALTGYLWLAVVSRRRLGHQSLLALLAVTPVLLAVGKLFRAPWVSARVGDGVWQLTGVHNAATLLGMLSAAAAMYPLVAVAHFVSTGRRIGWWKLALVAAAAAIAMAGLFIGSPLSRSRSEYISHDIAFTAPVWWYWAIYLAQIGAGCGYAVIRAADLLRWTRRGPIAALTAVVAAFSLTWLVYSINKLVDIVMTTQSITIIGRDQLEAISISFGLVGAALAAGLPVAHGLGVLRRRARRYRLLRTRMTEWATARAAAEDFVLTPDAVPQTRRQLWQAARTPELVQRMLIEIRDAAFTSARQYG